MYGDLLAVVADNNNMLIQKQIAKIAQHHEMCGK